jgi:hypothetical protein
LLTDKEKTEKLKEEARKIVESEIEFLQENSNLNYAQLDSIKISIERAYLSGMNKGIKETLNTFEKSLLQRN